jgi:hypothetical protein
LRSALCAKVSVGCSRKVEASTFLAVGEPDYWVNWRSGAGSYLCHLDFHPPQRKTQSMLEGLLQPMHLLVLIVILVPAFVVLRLLWKLGTRLGRPPAPPK